MHYIVYTSLTIIIVKDRKTKQRIQKRSLQKSHSLFKKNNKRTLRDLRTPICSVNYFYYLCMVVWRFNICAFL